MIKENMENYMEKMENLFMKENMRMEEEMEKEHSILQIAVMKCIR